MSVNSGYKQCLLEKQEGNIRSEQVAWIPTKYAKLGNTLVIKGDRYWRVVSVGLYLSDEYVSILSREHLSHRNVTDI